MPNAIDAVRTEHARVRQLESDLEDARAARRHAMYAAVCAGQSVPDIARALDGDYSLSSVRGDVKLERELAKARHPHGARPPIDARA